MIDDYRGRGGFDSTLGCGRSTARGSSSAATALTFVEGWQLPKEPDLVVSVSPKPFTIPARGEVQYQYFRVDPQLTEDKWVQAAELQPGIAR